MPAKIIFEVKPAPEMNAKDKFVIKFGGHLVRDPKGNPTLFDSKATAQVEADKLQKAYDYVG